MPFHNLTGTLGLLLAAPTTTTTATKTTSSTTTFVIVILFFGAAYFLWIRPSRARMRARQGGGPGAVPGQRTEAVEGDTVVTSSGIIGRVVEIEGDRASVEIAPGTIVAIHKNSLGRPLDMTPPPPPDYGTASSPPPSASYDPPHATYDDAANGAPEPHDDGAPANGDGAQTGRDNSPGEAEESS